VEPWSLPELDPVRFVFFFVVLFVVGANCWIQALAYGNGGCRQSPAELYFISRSISLGWMFVDRSSSIVVAGLLWCR
jgi:hypothetical protein